MKLIKNKFIALCGIVTILLFGTAAFAKDMASYIDLKSVPPHVLTDKISMHFLTSAKFTVIQWNLKAGGKLLPVHKHINEQVTRVMEGDVRVVSDDKDYVLHAGDIMIFPPNVPHGFIALTDAVIYEQQTPRREDFLQKDFIEKLRYVLQQNQ